MSDDSNPFFDDIGVKVTYGLITYNDRNKKPQKFYFQCNPASLSRSRTASRTTSRAGNANSMSKGKTGDAGRKFTYTVSWWKIDAFEIWLDASNVSGTNLTSSPNSPPPPTNGSSPTPPPKDQPKDKPLPTVRPSIQYVMDGIKHLEALVEPKWPEDENEHPAGYLPMTDPPRVILAYGPRQFEGYVTSVTILEKEFTPDLHPRLVKATLSLELLPLQQAVDQGKTGGVKT